MIPNDASSATPSSAPNTVDILVAIDGTGSKDWLRIDQESQKRLKIPEDPNKKQKQLIYKPLDTKNAEGLNGTNSHVLNFYRDIVAHRFRKIYLHGPGNAGFEVGSIADRGCAYIESSLQKELVDHRKKLSAGPATLADLGIRIILVGHSRGATAAILIAKQLKRLKVDANIPTLHVHFLGLYDAVDRHIGEVASLIPGNVNCVYHALRDRSISDWWNYRNAFGNTGTEVESPCKYTAKVFKATHSSIGGDPWGGDQPRKFTKQLDIEGGQQVDRWVRKMAALEKIRLT